MRNKAIPQDENIENNPLYIKLSGNEEVYVAKIEKGKTASGHTLMLMRENTSPTSSVQIVFGAYESIKFELATDEQARNLYTAMQEIIVTTVMKERVV